MRSECGPLKAGRKSKALSLFIISDGTGETAERLVRSALIQFDEPFVRLIKRPRVRTPQRVRAVIAEAARQQALVLHTLVSNDLRLVLLDAARTAGVDAMDLMGPLLERFAFRLNLTPMEKPGLFRKLNEAKLRVIEAVDFAFHHDDGRNPDDLRKAEIVLVGVSRTMKTPTMLFLAYRGWFAANVPLMKEIPPPRQLTRLPAERVFWLDIAPTRLLEWREARIRSLNLPIEGYATLRYIQQEQVCVSALCRSNQWRRVDVTGKSVEEVAREILHLHASSAGSTAVEKSRG